MKLKKEGLATIGLIFITFLAAIQYVFLRNVPDSVSTFSFVCITNLIGLVILGLVKPKKLLTIPGKTLKKGVLFAVELTGFSFFLLLGSQHMDAVVVSSVVSLYFVFITPMLLLLRKKVNFFSGIATVIAIIALLLMFGADTNALFSSIDVVYLILADLFFAAYVVSVSILGESEDSTQLTLSQMIFASIFAFIGWGIETLISGSRIQLPTEINFWISALFFGIFIRAVYADGYGVALFDAHAHQRHQLQRIDGLLTLCYGYSGAVLLDLLHQDACRTCMNAHRIGNRVLKCLQFQFLLLKFLSSPRFPAGNPQFCPLLRAALNVFQIIGVCKKHRNGFIVSCRLDLIDAETDQRLSGFHCIAFRDEAFETIAVHVDGIHTDMDQHLHFVRFDTDRMPAVRNGRNRAVKG